MTTLWVLFGLLQASGAAVALLSIWRLYAYIRRYRFDESKYTLLFGFVHLHWIMLLYVVAVLIWSGLSFIIFTRL